MSDGTARDRPSPYGEEKPFLARSAGACPPRAFDPREKRTPTKALSSIDSTARDRPSPYGETETALQTVARRPVPREFPSRPTKEDMCLF